MLLDECVVGVECKAILEVNLCKCIKTKVVALIVGIAGSIAEADKLTSFILFSIVANDITPRTEERTPAPYILVRTLAAYIRIIERTVVVACANTHLQPIGCLSSDVGSQVVAVQYVGVEVHQALTAVVVTADVEVSLA